MVKYSRKPGVKIGRKKSYAKKTYKKSYSTNRLTKLVKRVALKAVMKKSETKSTHVTEENKNLYHNVGYNITGLLNTTQAISDNQAGTSVLASRIGDQVSAKGLGIKLWLSNKLDRPNVMYRLFVYMYQSQTLPTMSDLFKSQLGNRMMDDIDVESYKILYHKRVNLQVGYSNSGGGGGYGKECHKYLSIWIPLKLRNLIYNDGGSIPKFKNIGFAIVPFDSYGTLTTDNIASFAYSYKFYFKDL